MHQENEQQLMFVKGGNLEERKVESDFSQVLSAGVLLRWQELGQYDDNAIHEIAWPKIATDTDKYYQAFYLIEQTASLSDLEFTRTVLPEIKTILKETQLFQALASEQIILTKEHRVENINSQDHVIKVCENLLTSSLPDRERYLMRLFALMHDNAKMLVVGYDGNVEQLMKEIGNVNKNNEVPDSFVNHQQTSADILQSLLNHDSFGHLFSSGEQAYLQTLISHHHYFVKLGKFMHEEIFDEKGYFAAIPELVPTAHWRYLLHSFIFNLADTSATKGHWQHLAGNVARFAQVTKFYATCPDCDKQLLQQMQLTIKQANVKYEDMMLKAN